MAKLHYKIVDVFTDRAFGGNPLAVFTDGRGISGETMQAIAKELNLSETTFVLPPESSENTYRVRIFTPGVEMPMAGHPTVGTSFVLAREKMIELTGDETVIRLEEIVGPIPVTLRSKNGVVNFAEMRQPLPTFGPRITDREAIARTLSLEPSALDERYPTEVVSCGVPFLFVPLKDLAAIRQIQFRREVWEKLMAGTGVNGMFVFTQETETTKGTVHSRMFAPGMGVQEDPATGGASGPLGSYLVRYGLVESGPEVKILSEQGFEMGRPSFIHIRIQQQNSEISGVYVGGEAFYMGEGTLEVA